MAAPPPAQMVRRPSESSSVGSGAIITTGNDKAQGASASGARSANERRGSARRGSDLNVEHSRLDAAQGEAKLQKGIFANKEQLKAEYHKDLDKKEYNVADFYWPEGSGGLGGKAADLARNETFGGITLGLISFNAVYLGVDTDHNTAVDPADAHIFFKIGEQFFCFFFTFELLTRFFSFKEKKNCLRDGWFKFDSLLVGLMVMETWVFALLFSGGGSGMGDMSLLRLFRLLRLSRMTRLMRAVPELMMLFRGMAAATRSVSTTMTLLILIMYVFGIIFKVQLGADESMEEFFSSIPLAMWTLFLAGTLLDNITDVAGAIREASPVMCAVFFVFMILSAIMTMNMLIGILCEVISAVADAEKEKLLVDFVKGRLLDILEKYNEYPDGEGQGEFPEGKKVLTKAQFQEVLENPDAQKAIEELGVDEKHLELLTDTLFEDEFEGDDHEEGEERPAKEMPFSEFMETLMHFRLSNEVSVAHIMDLRKYIRFTQKALDKQVEEVQEQQDDIASDVANLKAIVDACTMNLVGGSKKVPGNDA